MCAIFEETAGEEQVVDVEGCGAEVGFVHCVMGAAQGRLGIRDVVLTLAIEDDYKV